MSHTWELRRIEPGTAEYAEAKHLRYQELYGDWGLPTALVEDTDGNTYLHFAAFVDTRAVGYARLHLEGGQCKIYQVCVDREFRGQGIARAMMLELLRSAREAGRTEILLDARETAIGFYERLGFVAEGEVFLSPRTNTPHQAMRLRLE